MFIYYFNKEGCASSYFGGEKRGVPCRRISISIFSYVKIYPLHEML